MERPVTLKKEGIQTRNRKLSNKTKRMQKSATLSPSSYHHHHLTDLFRSSYSHYFPSMSTYGGSGGINGGGYYHQIPPAVISTAGMSAYGGHYMPSATGSVYDNVSEGHHHVHHVQQLHHPTHHHQPYHHMDGEGGGGGGGSDTDGGMFSLPASNTLASVSGSIVAGAPA